MAVYRRSIAASPERVWENVRDWEHLPWLHRKSFCSIALDAASASGWRAQIGLQPSRAGNEILLELAIEPHEPRYVSRTLEGAGRGSEIWTRVTPVAPDGTDIEVEFWLPGVAPEQAAGLGAIYTGLYQRLWDEDETMMRRRARLLAVQGEPAAPRRTGADEALLELGPLDALRARLPLVVDWAGGRWRVVEIDGALAVHATVCPHWLGPLDEARVEDGCIRCPWHGWRFDVRSGRSADGRRARLAPPPRIEQGPDGSLRLAATRPEAARDLSSARAAR